MKKYVKPALIYERFELTQNIADCAWQMNNEKDACTASPDPNFWGDDYGATLFTSGLGCTNQTDVPGIYEGYCYQAGTDPMLRAFKS